MSIPLIGQQQQQVNIEMSLIPPQLFIKRGIDWTVLDLPLPLVRKLHDGLGQILAQSATQENGLAAFDALRRPGD